MGIVAEQVGGHFLLPWDNRRKALRELQRFMKDHDHQPDDKAFKWLNGVNHKQWVSITEALRDWRFESSENTRGDIISLVFVGEKLGDEFDMFSRLAPYVSDGSYIILDYPHRDNVGYEYVFFESDDIRVSYCEANLERENIEGLISQTEQLSGLENVFNGSFRPEVRGVR